MLHTSLTPHSRRVPSRLPESAQWPSAQNATETTAPVCPSKVRTQRPVATSHSRRVLSQLPDSAQRPTCGYHHSRSVATFGFFQDVRRFLPLPEGEGRG